MFDPIEAIKAFVRFPSVSTDPAFQDGMDGAREYVVDLLESMNLDVSVIETPKHPIVIAKRDGPQEWPHVVIYGHYDVQPADPLNLWETDPFDPVEKDGRLYGRGTADNKGPMMVHIAAAARLLEQNPDAPIRLTFIIEGEEEIGSPSFPKVLNDYKQELSGDYILLSDTSSPNTKNIALTTGLRGIISFEIFVDGPHSDLHSGIHGGAIRNPIQALTKLCASFHDDEGRVTIPGFYDDVELPQDWEREEIARLGTDVKAYCQSVGVSKPWTVGALSPMEATRLMPTLEFNGIGGGYQGEGEKTIIPAKAFVKISCRLVANQTPEDIRMKLESAIAERSPEGVKIKVVMGHDGPPYMVVPPGKANTPADQNPYLANAFKAADAAITHAFGSPPLYIREGGSIPIIGTIKQLLGMDALMLGMFTPKDNLHAPNESFDLDMFANGIETSFNILKSTADSFRK